MKRMLPPLAFLLSIGLMLVLHTLWPMGALVAAPYNLTGVVLLAVGLAGAVWGALKFARVGTNIKTFDDPDKLVIDGLFRYSRNPMYLGFVVALTGVSVLLGSLSPLLIVLAFIVLTDLWYIRFEEAKLAERFGAQYEAYQERTRRWL